MKEYLENLVAENKNEFSAADRALFENFKAALRRGEIRAGNYSDLVSLTLHRLVARRLRTQPNLIALAKANLQNWLSQNPTTPAWLEWQEILETGNLEKILKIINLRHRRSTAFAFVVAVRRIGDGDGT